MSKVTLLTAEMAKRIHAEWGRNMQSPDWCALQSIATGHSVCLPVSTLREIVGEMRKQAELYRLNSNNVVATLCGNAFNEFADTIEKLLPAKEG